MKLYTGACGGEKKDHCMRLGVGFMLSGVTTKTLCKGIPCAIDNGAYEAWRRGLPWLESRFMRLLENCWNKGVTADFIVAPDIVAGGMDSMDFSLSWVDRLRPARLALAVQDGIKFESIGRSVANQFAVLFVGGTADWKWQTAAQWVRTAHDHGMKCHIGRVGTLARLQYAKQIGADSVDSTSWARNGSWHILERFAAKAPDVPPRSQTG